MAIFWHNIRFSQI